MGFKAADLTMRYHYGIPSSQMASLLIKNIPAKLHRALKKQALTNRRSLNRETIEVLEKAVQNTLGKKTAASSGEMPLSDAVLAKLPADVTARLLALRSLNTPGGLRRVATIRSRLPALSDQS